MILRQGTRRFGQPDATTVQQLERIDEPVALEQIGLRLLEVESWEELLAGVVNSTI